MSQTRAAMATAGLFAAAVVILPFAVAPAMAQTPMLISEERDWKAISADGQRGKTCYAISKPTRMEPSTLNHGEVFFFISTRPGDRVTNEPSLQVGYNLREGTPVIAEIDGAKFTMFARADGAWLQNAADEPKLVAALRTGRSLIVNGTSGRGNATKYTFSLAGVSAALEAVSRTCK
jgi:invasion protein IalB